MARRLDDQVASDVSSELAAAALAMARRFAEGATLWCWAPGAAQHAQHLAVEFVHPVIAGARALPAVALVDDDPVAVLRSMARAGDVLVVVAESDAPVTPLLRRAEAWGLTTVWLGAGVRPVARTADHVLWSDDPAAWHDGRLVLGYHLIWELTHVCFEHPGLLEPANEPGGPDETVCTTCSDEGRLGEVVRCGDDLATVRTACGTEIISTLLVSSVNPGDLVLVHAGMAISVVDS